MNDVGYTCQITAGFRAVELQNHQEPIIVDHLAVHLAGDAFKTALQDWQRLVAAQGPGKSLRVPARNRLIDDLLLQAIKQLTSHNTQLVVQVVNVGCGMDSKPWRLQLPNCTVHWFDIDQPAVLQLKQQLLQQADAALSHPPQPQEPAAQHRHPLLVNRWHPVLADLSETSLADALIAAGFQPGVCTIWLAEALLYYLPLDIACQLLHQMHKLSGPDSKLIATCIDRELQLAHQGLTADHYFATSKVQWHFDMDALQHELEGSGWKVDMQPRTTADLALEWYKRETYVALYGGAECCFAADLSTLSPSSAQLRVEAATGTTV